MIIKQSHFDLQKIANSGQCFRMRPVGNGAYIALSGIKSVVVTPLGDEKFDFACADDDFAFWHHYFDLQTDYEHFFSRIDPRDDFLTAAANYGHGIRILRQELFETTISFIISQRKNIPAITKSIELLCERFGTPIQTKCGGAYAFPSPEALCTLSIEEIRDCALGYRDKYVLSAAKAFASGQISTAILERLNQAQAIEALTSLYGVGKKVASCIALFALHDIAAFPIDVWIDRILQAHYNGSFPIGRYEGFAGVMQQYLFYYARSDAYDYAAKHE